MVRVWTHLSRNRRAAGVRYSTAFRARVLVCTIKIHVPGPVCVVVPPTTLELSKKKQDTKTHTHIYLETGSCNVLYILAVWASPVGNPGLTSGPACADGGGISYEETHRAQEVNVRGSLSCGKPSLRPT